MAEETTVWVIEDNWELPHVTEDQWRLGTNEQAFRYGTSIVYREKLDAYQFLRNELMLMAEAIEDKLLEVRQEIHRLKGER